MVEAALENGDVRPVVATGRPSNLTLWAFMGLLLLGGIWLFSMMSANRSELAAPRTTAVEPEPGTRIGSPPPLALPEEYLAPQAEPRRVRIVPQPAPAPVRAVAATPAAPRPRTDPAPRIPLYQDSLIRRSVRPSRRWFSMRRCGRPPK